MNSKNRLKPDDRFRQKKGVIHRSLDEQMILLKPGASRPVRLNEMGSRLWRLMERPVRMADLISLAASDYRIDRDRAMPDIAAFLTDLLERRLIIKEGA